MNKKLYQGHFVRNRFGQIFLTDQLIIDQIVTIFNPKSNQAIVEIGPGLGALTLPISKYIKNMTVVEIDYDLSFRLSNNPKINSKLTILQNDVLKIDFSLIAKEKGQSIRLLGNLPYNISIPLIFYLFTYIDSIIDMNFMLQKEVVDRLLATPNVKAYGPLSVIVQYYCQVNPILPIVSASSFTPSPKVNSALVGLIPHKINPYPVCDVKLLKYIITQAFNQRRKIISNSLSNLFSKRDFCQLNIDPNSRAENLSVENYCNLARKLSSA